MDQIDRHLLTLVQHKISVQKDPFLQLASALGVDHAEFLLRIQRLKKQGTIKCIQAVFNTVGLEYQVLVVAMEIPGQRLKRALEVAQSHPAVKFGFTSDHRFNFWMRFEIPSSEPVSERIQEIHALTGALTTIPLPVVREYRRDEEISYRLVSSGERAVSFSRSEIECLRALQEDFPLTDFPFRVLANRYGMEENDLLLAARDFKKKGILSKIRAKLAPGKKDVITHFIAWQIPEEKRHELAVKIAQFEKVRYVLELLPAGPIPYSVMVAARFESDIERNDFQVLMDQELGPWTRSCFDCHEFYENSLFKYYHPQLSHWHLETKLPD